MHTPTVPVVFAIAVLGIGLLAGCTSSSVSDPAVPDTVGTQDCVVGTWNLDINAFAADSEAFLLSTGMPLESFVMDGSGKLTFTDDGLVSADVGLDTSVVAGGVAINAPSNYRATGDWSRTSDSELRFDNWARVGDEPDIPPEVELPELDLTQLVDVTAECSGDNLFLQGSEAPFGAHWTK